MRRIPTRFLAGRAGRFRAVVLALLVGAAMVGHPAASGAAAPRAVRCGDVITANAVLTADLRCPTGNGVTLSGGVTLDLRGHRLIGSRTGVGVSFGTGGGTPTVRNGSIEGWGSGMANLDFDNSAAVRGVRFLGNGSGINGYTYHVTVDDSVFENNGAGIAGIYSTATVTRGVFRKNGTAVTAIGVATLVQSVAEANGAVFDCGDNHCIARTSTLRGNGVVATAGRAWIELFDNVIVDNTTVVATSYQDSVDVARNRIVGNDVGVRVSADTWLSRIRVHDNTFVANRSAVSVGENDPPDRNTSIAVERNVFTANVDALVAAAPASLVRVGGNKAISNSGRGIHTPGAVDLGGNVAYGNGVQPQCVGVVCAGRG